MTLWLVRHAQPLIVPGVCYGATDVAADAALTELAAQALAPQLPPGARVLSSPLRRCWQLSVCLQRWRPDLSYSRDVRLQEMNFGRWEGQRWDDIAPSELQGWSDAFRLWRCGGAECVQDVMTRVASVWDEACAAVPPHVWITHAGVIRAAMLLAQGQRQIERADQWPRAGVALGAHLTLAT